MIEVKHLTKRYGKHTAVDDISFTVQDGCIYGLLGPNGAGKSTTMNMITGYLAPTGGTVAIDGHDVQEEPKEAKACIGYLPEIPPLYTDMTVQEYLLFVSELKGKKKKADRVQDVAQAVQLRGPHGGALPPGRCQIHPRRFHLALWPRPAGQQHPYCPQLCQRRGDRTCGPAVYHLRAACHTGKAGGYPLCIRNRPWRGAHRLNFRSLAVLHKHRSFPSPSKPHKTARFV